MLNRRFLLALLTIGFAGLFFSGCASKTVIPVKKEVGQANYKTLDITKEPSTGKTIAIVETAINIPEVMQKLNTQMSTNPFMAAMAANMQQVSYNPYQELDVNALKKALGRVFTEILSNKGFATKGPYKTFDDITYTDKKDTYLAIIPILDLAIETKTTSVKPEQWYYTEEGVMMLGGEFYLKVMEPLTQQVLMNKRISLTDMNLQKPYMFQKQNIFTTGSMTDDLIAKASLPDQLIDNTDKVRTELLTEFYNQAVEKLNTYLSREELLSYQKDVKKLKDLKRF